MPVEVLNGGQKHKAYATRLVFAKAGPLLDRVEQLPAAGVFTTQIIHTQQAPSDE
jgi:hypothetical protein